MAVAELGYKIESDDVVVAEKRLIGLEKASKKVDQSNDSLTNTTKRVKDELSKFTPIIDTTNKSTVKLSSVTKETSDALEAVRPKIDNVNKATDDLGKTSIKTTDSVKGSRDEYGKLVPQVDKAEQSSDKLSKTQERLAKSLGRAVGRMVAFAAAAVSIRVTISTLANFEDGMARLGAITRASEADLAKLRDTAKDLGATTEFSATQAADGLTFLGQAGFTAAESMAAIPAVLDLATASGMGLAQAADTASNIMSGFGIAAGDAALVADVLAAASSRANTNVSQLGSAMSTVAPIAAAMGIDLNTTAAAIGVMSDAGIQGERAGTALRGVLASLAGPTKQASDALSKYGLTAADVDPQVHGLANVFETLRERGLSTADAMQIFGREAASGALVLIESASRVGDFADELSDAEGEAARMAETMRGALGGSLKTLQSSVEALILAMGEAGLTAAIQAVVGVMTAIIRVITQAVELTVEYRGQIIAAATAMTVYFIPSIISAIGVIGTAIASTYSWIAALVTLRGALITTGIGAFIVLAGSLINALLTLRERTGSWGEAFALLGDIVTEVLGRIPLAFNGVLSKTKGFALEISAAAADMAANAIEFIISIPSKAVEAFDWAVDAISTLFKNLPAIIGSAVVSAVNFVIEKVEALVQKSIDVINVLIAGINKIPGVVVDALGPVSVGRVTNQFGDTLSKITDFDASKGIDSLRKTADGLRDNAQNSSLAGDALLSMATSPLDALSKLRDSINETNETINEVVVSPLVPGGGIPGVGGDGKGKKGKKSEQQSRIDALIESLQSEQEVITRWYAQAQLDLISATDAELELIGGRNEAKLRLETEYQERLANIRGVGENQALANTSSMLNSMAVLAQAGGKKTFKIWKAFSIAQATIDSYRAFTQVLADPAFIGRPWARAAAAGAVLASGLAQVSNIASTNIGGSSGGSGGGAGAGSVPQQAPQAPPQTRAIIQATGGRSRFTIEEINDIISGIQKESKDGVIIEGFTS